MNTEKFTAVIAAIDGANAQDPKEIVIDGDSEPGELVYGQRMSAALEQIAPGASDHLKIAARAQHIERWRSPRSDYPEGKAGYLKWRADLKDFHAKRTSEIMREAGLGKEDIERVEMLVRKKAIKRDAEAQAVEDAACLVFLEHYAPDFIAKHEDEKVISILAKTARKMSDTGLAAAGRLPLTGRLATLLQKALGF